MNPATETLIRELEEDTPASVAEKFRRAKQAQAAWARVPSRAPRRDPAFPRLVAERKEKLAATIDERGGQADRPVAQRAERASGPDRFFPREHREDHRDEDRPERPAQKLEERIAHEPLGVIANISAWNYPYFVGSNVFVPALLTGNAVLYKPSEFATLTGLAIAELSARRRASRKTRSSRWSAAGRVGAELLKQPIDGVFFTGSYATGAKIAEAAARKLIKVQLELGGKDPVYVADDVADVKAVAEGDGRRRVLQHRPELLLGRAHLRARRRSTTPSSTRSSRRSRASSSAIRRTTRLTSARSRAPRSSRCSRRRSPTRKPRARSS